MRHLWPWLFVLAKYQPTVEYFIEQKKVIAYGKPAATLGGKSIAKKRLAMIQGCYYKAEVPDILRRLLGYL